MFLLELYGGRGRVEHAYLRSYQKCYEDLGRLLKPEVQAALLAAEPQVALLAPYFGGCNMTSFLNRLMHLNVRLKGACHILTKVNNLTSANGVLGRSPLSTGVW